MSTMPRTVHSAEFEEMPNHWSVRPLLSGNRACALHHRLLLAIGVLAVAACLPGCSSAPKAQDVVYGTTLPPQFGQFHHHPFFTGGCDRAARAQRGSNAQPIGPDVGSLLPSSNAILSSNLPDSAKLRCAQLLGHLRAVLANEEIKLRQNGHCISRSVEVNGRPQSTTRECVRAEDNAYPWTSVGWR